MKKIVLKFIDLNENQIEYFLYLLNEHMIRTTVTVDGKMTEVELTEKEYKRISSEIKDGDTWEYLQLIDTLQIFKRTYTYTDNLIWNK